MANAEQGSPEHYKGMYASLKFPPYRHQEYPKILYREEDRKSVLGVANNAKEEQELYASIGVEKGDIDPHGAALDEIAMLKAKLAKYEGDVAAEQIAPQKAAGVKTTTVEMLPAEPVATAPAPIAAAAALPANPLLKR